MAAQPLDSLKLNDTFMFVDDERLADYPGLNLSKTYTVVDADKTGGVRIDVRGESNQYAQVSGDLKVELVTEEKPKRTVPADNFMGTISANVDNTEITDTAFRKFIRKTLPIVIFERYEEKTDKAESQELEHVELFSYCVLHGHLPKWEGRGGVDGCGLKVATCERCEEELATFMKDFTKEKTPAPAPV